MSEQGQLLTNEPLAHYTTWRVGGPAKALYKPAGLDDLARFLRQLPSEETPIWIGLGSNALIRDQGIPHTVILTQGCLNDLTLLDNQRVRVEAGVSCAKMARFCARNGLSGGEFWAGIPGTMGGALRMNAGCFNGETWRWVEEVEVMTRQGTIQRRSPSDFKIAYRHVEGLAADEWFVAATCRLTSGHKDESMEQIKTLLARRAATQPTNEFNCGSVFRNPPNHYAAQLIEQCHLKGQRMGGAMVSTKHANFIINDDGKATAHDIETLIQFVQKTVYDQTAIKLHPEVHILGEAAC